MKWYYRFFVVAILAAALIGPFFIKSPDGKPVMEMPTAQDFIPEQLFSGGSNSNTGSPLSSDGPSYYKWQDEQGQWHYGDQPPTDSSKVSTLQVDTNTNIIQGLKIEPEVTEGIPQEVNQQQKLPDRLTSGELSMENAVNSINDALLVRDMMESRNEQLKAITGE
jgi:hypothetical protein